jgi:hypothetical protein
MTAWTDFIREYAKEHNTSYGCALSTPDCSKQYFEKKNKPKVIRMKRDEDYKKHKYRLKPKSRRYLELANMGLEDNNLFKYRQQLDRLQEEIKLMMYENPVDYEGISKRLKVMVLVANRNKDESYDDFIAKTAVYLMELK